MNILKKTACAVLAVIITVGVLLCACSCNEQDDPTDRGTLIATYKGGEIYSGDISDWQLYYVTHGAAEILDAISKSGLTTAEEVKKVAEAKKNEILDKTTDYVVQMKAIGQYIKDKDIASLSEESIKNYADVLKVEIEDAYADKGGYNYWKETICGGVSDNFIYQYAEFDMIALLIEDCITNAFPITDEDVMEYWEFYKQIYLVVPSYYFDAIIVTIPETSRGGEADWNAAREEALGYIERIKAGEDFSEIKEEAIANSKNATVSKLYSVRGTVSEKDAAVMEDYDARYAELMKYINSAAKSLNVEFVEYADPHGDSAVSELWYEYCSNLNEIKVKNTLLTLGEGEVYSEPVIYPGGYEIIQLVAHYTETEFRSPLKYEDVYRDIYNAIYDSLWDDGEGPSVEQFVTNIYKEYDVKIVYSYSSEK